AALVAPGGIGSFPVFGNGVSGGSGFCLRDFLALAMVMLLIGRAGLQPAERAGRWQVGNLPYLTFVPLSRCCLGTVRASISPLPRGPPSLTALFRIWLNWRCSFLPALVSPSF